MTEYPIIVFPHSIHFDKETFKAMGLICVWWEMVKGKYLITLTLTDEISADISEEGKLLRLELILKI